MKYVKRYNKFNLQTKCRICLTQSVSKMVALDEPLKGEMFPKPLVYEAIEFVMSKKVNLSRIYPHVMCAICVELLKISYDLKIQYQQSEKTLKRQLEDLSDSDSTGESEKTAARHNINENNNDSKALVEVVLGHQKFNIKDLLIVEEENENQNNQLYDGFLNNLGTIISASFVKKGSEKPKPVLEEPSIVIEKISQEPVETSENQDIQPNLTEIYKETTENTYDYDLNQPNKDVGVDIQQDDAIFIDTPVDDEILDRYVILNDKDREAFELALNYKYKCPYCEKPMSTLKKVRIHSSVCMKNKLNVMCYICDKKFRLRKYLLNHLKDVHRIGIGKSVTSKESDKHKCNICDKIFQSNGSLFYHMNKHLGRRYPCDQCDKRFYTRGQAMTHKQTHNRNETLVICPICGKGFHYQSGLFYHMKIHTNERNYQCSYCSRKFYTRNSVKRHELTHTGGRPYGCSHCEKRFRSLGEVKKHELLHTGQRPFQCQYCSMGFTQAHNLKVHLMTHPGNYECNHCSRGFAENSILRFHMRNKHGLSTAIEENEELPTEVEGETVEHDVIEDTIDETTIQEKDILDETDQFFITEDFVEDVEEDGDGVSIVKTYELRDEVLVETVESELLQ